VLNPEKSSRSPTAPEADRADQERVSSAFRRLRDNPDFALYREILTKRRVAEGEFRVNEMLRAADGRIVQGNTPLDLGQWARTVSYWRGYADGLHFAAMIVERTVLADEKPEPKEERTDGDRGH